MKCDFDTFKVSLFSVSHVDIFVNSEFRILMVDSMLSPSMKILVSSANKIENILFETFLRSLIYNINKSGPSTEPWGTPTCDFIGLSFFVFKNYKLFSEVKITSKPI